MCIVAGLVVGGYFVRAIWRTMATRRWRISRAKILESYVKDLALPFSPA
jgi:uncharacterized membrane protein YccC